MKEKICPIMVSTMEALKLSVKEGDRVVHVDKSMLVEDKKIICKFMKDNGYFVPEKKGKSGMFFARKAGPSAFNRKVHDIYDPYDIL